MEAITAWIIYLYSILELCNGFPATPSDGLGPPALELGSLAPALLAALSILTVVLLLAGCSLCRFFTHKWSANSQTLPEAVELPGSRATVSVDSGIVNPIADRQFTIFDPLAVSRALPPPPLSPPAVYNLPLPPDNAVEDNNNGPISEQELENIVNNNAENYITSEYENRNLNQEVVEVVPGPTTSRSAHTTPQREIFSPERLEQHSDWFDKPIEDSPRNRLRYLQEIGRGWFGRIVEGEAHDPEGGSPSSPFVTRVAVKILDENVSVTQKCTFLEDCRLYKDLQHDNILKFMGRNFGQDPWLVLFEFCPMGDLKQFLLSNKTQMESLTQQGIPLKFQYEIASALAYLHSKNMIHPDVACHSCMVAEGPVARLGDYGDAERRHPGDFSWLTGGKPLPLRWMAPEALTLQMTQKSNVWSLGVFLWESCSWGDMPHAALTDTDVQRLLLSPEGLRLPPPPLSAHAQAHLYNVMLSCWQQDPSSRCMSSQVCSYLRDLYTSYYDPSTGLKPDDSVMHNFDARWQNLKSNSIPIVDNGLPYSPPPISEDIKFFDLKFPPNDLSTDNDKLGVISETETPVSADVTIEEEFLKKIKSDSLTNLHGSIESVRDHGSEDGHSIIQNDIKSIMVNPLLESYKLTQEPIAVERTPSKTSFQTFSGDSTGKPVYVFKESSQVAPWIQDMPFTSQEDMSYIKTVSDVISDLDNMLSSEKTSSSESSHQASPSRDLMNNVRSQSIGSAVIDNPLSDKTVTPEGSSEMLELPDEESACSRSAMNLTSKPPESSEGANIVSEYVNSPSQRVPETRNKDVQEYYPTLDFRLIKLQDEPVDNAIHPIFQTKGPGQGQEFDSLQDSSYTPESSKNADKNKPEHGSGSGSGDDNWALKRQCSSGSETEDEIWKKRIEMGTITEKIKLKSKSVTDFMVLTHIDMDFTDLESEDASYTSLEGKAGAFDKLQKKIRYDSPKKDSSLPTEEYLSFPRNFSSTLLGRSESFKPGLDMYKLKKSLLNIILKNIRPTRSLSDLSNAGKHISIKELLAFKKSLDSFLDAKIHISGNDAKSKNENSATREDFLPSRLTIPDHQSPEATSVSQLEDASCISELYPAQIDSSPSANLKEEYKGTTYLPGENLFDFFFDNMKKESQNTKANFQTNIDGASEHYLYTPTEEEDFKFSSNFSDINTNLYVNGSADISENVLNKWEATSYLEPPAISKTIDSTNLKQVSDQAVVVNLYDSNELEFVSKECQQNTSSDNTQLSPVTNINGSQISSAPAISQDFQTLLKKDNVLTSTPEDMLDSSTSDIDPIDCIVSPSVILTITKCKDLPWGETEELEPTIREPASCQQDIEIPIQDNVNACSAVEQTLEEIHRNDITNLTATLAIAENENNINIENYSPPTADDIEHGHLDFGDHHDYVENENLRNNTIVIVDEEVDVPDELNIYTPIIPTFEELPVNEALIESLDMELSKLDFDNEIEQCVPIGKKESIEPEIVNVRGESKPSGWFLHPKFENSEEMIEDRNKINMLQNNSQQSVDSVTCYAVSIAGSTESLSEISGPDRYSLDAESVEALRNELELKLPLAQRVGQICHENLTDDLGQDKNWVNDLPEPLENKNADNGDESLCNQNESNDDNHHEQESAKDIQQQIVRNEVMIHYNMYGAVPLSPIQEESWSEFSDLDKLSAGDFDKTENSNSLSLGKLNSNVDNELPFRDICQAVNTDLVEKHGARQRVQSEEDTHDNSDTSNQTFIPLDGFVDSTLNRRTSVSVDSLNCFDDQVDLEEDADALKKDIPVILDFPLPSIPITELLSPYQDDKSHTKSTEEVSQHVDNLLESISKTLENASKVGSVSSENNDSLNPEVGNDELSQNISDMSLHNKEEDDDSGSKTYVIEDNKVDMSTIYNQAAELAADQCNISKTSQPSFVSDLDSSIGSESILKPSDKTLSQNLHTKTPSMDSWCSNDTLFNVEENFDDVCYFNDDLESPGKRDYSLSQDIPSPVDITVKMVCDQTVLHGALPDASLCSQPTIAKMDIPPVEMVMCHPQNNQLSSPDSDIQKCNIYLDSDTDKFPINELDEITNNKPMNMLANKSDDSVTIESDISILPRGILSKPISPFETLLSESPLNSIDESTLKLTSHEPNRSDSLSIEENDKTYTIQHSDEPAVTLCNDGNKDTRVESQISIDHAIVIVESAPTVDVSSLLVDDPSAKILNKEHKSDKNNTNIFQSVSESINVDEKCPIDNSETLLFDEQLSVVNSCSYSSPSQQEPEEAKLAITSTPMSDLTMTSSTPILPIVDLKMLDTLQESTKSPDMLIDEQFEFLEDIIDSSILVNDSFTKDDEVETASKIANNFLQAEQNFANSSLAEQLKSCPTDSIIVKTSSIESFMKSISTPTQDTNIQNTHIKSPDDILQLTINHLDISSINADGSNISGEIIDNFLEMEKCYSNPLSEQHASSLAEYAEYSGLNMGQSRISVPCLPAEDYKESPSFETFKELAVVMPQDLSNANSQTSEAQKKNSTGLEDLSSPGLSDIYFSGPSNEDIMSTSFNEDMSPVNESNGSVSLSDGQGNVNAINNVPPELLKEWDSESDESSGEFVWKDGDWDLPTTVSPPHSIPSAQKTQWRSEGGDFEAIAEESQSESGGGSGDEEEVEFVPSSWDYQALPSKSSLKSPETSQSEGRKRVVFKEQKYHCVYEYPREVSDNEAESPHLPDYSTYINSQNFGRDDEDRPYSDVDFDRYINSHHNDLNNPYMSDIPISDESFFISSSTRPFETYSLLSTSSQFFPGQHLSLLGNIKPYSGDIMDSNDFESLPPLPSLTLESTSEPMEDIVKISTLPLSSKSSLDFVTPDSGTEDVTPGSLLDYDFNTESGNKNASENGEMTIDDGQSPHTLSEQEVRLNSTNRSAFPRQFSGTIILPERGSPGGSLTPSPGSLGSLGSSSSGPPSPLGPGSLGGLRHTRDKLKLDLPPSPLAKHSPRIPNRGKDAKIFDFKNIDMLENDKTPSDPISDMCDSITQENKDQKSQLSETSSEQTEDISSMMSPNPSLVANFESAEFFNSAKDATSLDFNYSSTDDQVDSMNTVSATEKLRSPEKDDEKNVNNTEKVPLPLTNHEEVSTTLQKAVIPINVQDNSRKVILEPVKGEGTLLDSGDEDSGIGSSAYATLERKMDLKELEAEASKGYERQVN